MGFLKRILTKKEKSIQSYSDFWEWFTNNEDTFFFVVKEHKNIESDFFSKLSPKLNQLKKGFFFLTGMLNDNTAELILTADGNIKNIAFAEDLVSAAPNFDNWKITALKPSSDIKNVSIKMDGFDFNKDNLNFIFNENKEFPDLINITIIHDNYTENNKSTIINGTYIFLDNYLGELHFTTIIDDINFVPKKNIDRELISIDKLKEFINWREKEFTEKYDGVMHNTDNDSYVMMEAELNSGNMLIAVINKDLLNWDSKASHPWILVVEIEYDGTKNNGMPNEETYQLLNTIEDEIIKELTDFDGYLNIGRQSADGIREIYFACKDFRKPSKILYKMEQKYPLLHFDLYKDKYWQTFKRFE